MGQFRSITCSALFCLLFLSGACTTTKNYEQAYRRAWRKIIRSQAWYDALRRAEADRDVSGDVYYPLPGTFENSQLRAWATEKMEEEFLELYRSLVFRAYFRTIAEAEEADSRIYEAYNELRQQRPQAGNRKDPAFQEKLEYARRRYQAHRQMLEGLKSWKAFNEYGSDDLDFFLREHLPEAYDLYREGRGEAAILEFLVYRLADLYHFEEPKGP